MTKQIVLDGCYSCDSSEGYVCVNDDYSNVTDDAEWMEYRDCNHIASYPPQMREVTFVNCSNSPTPLPATVVHITYVRDEYTVEAPSHVTSITYVECERIERYPSSATSVSFYRCRNVPSFENTNIQEVTAAHTPINTSSLPATIRYYGELNGDESTYPSSLDGVVRSPIGATVEVDMSADVLVRNYSHELTLVPMRA